MVGRLERVNIEERGYVKEVLSDVKDFIWAMQDISPEEIRRSGDLVRPYAGCSVEG